MPSKKKKYNARFPAGRIKKIMQTDEEVGKVAQAVPVIISKALEMFIESLLKKSAQITINRNAKTLTPSHMKQCILSENRFDFLKDLVKNVPDASAQEDNENNLILEDSNFSKNNESDSNSVGPSSPDSKDNRFLPDQIASSSSTTTSSRMPVIQFCPKNETSSSRAPKLRVRDTSQINFSVSSILTSPDPKIEIEQFQHNHIDQRFQSSPLNLQIATPQLAPVSNSSSTAVPKLADNVPPLVPIVRTQTNPMPDVRTPFYGLSAGDNLCIDEDYDN